MHTAIPGLKNLVRETNAGEALRRDSGRVGSLRSYERSPPKFEDGSSRESLRLEYEGSPQNADGVPPSDGLRSAMSLLHLWNKRRQQYKRPEDDLLRDAHGATAWRLKGPQ